MYTNNHLIATKPTRGIEMSTMTKTVSFSNNIKETQRAVKSNKKKIHSPGLVRLMLILHVSSASTHLILVT